jgi:hypothetical protein
LGKSLGDRTGILLGKQKPAPKFELTKKVV